MRKIMYLAVLVLSFNSFAQNDAKRINNFNLDNKLALQGFDPVSYFKNKPVKGKSTIYANYEGVIYNFSTPTNKDLFLKTPANYEPQFGGWCAYAMGSYGDKVEVDPQTFKIIDGKLYLFYNAYFNNTLKSWNKDESDLKPKAEANWKKLIK